MRQNWQRATAKLPMREEIDQSPIVVSKKVVKLASLIFFLKFRGFAHIGL